MLYEGKQSHSGLYIFNPTMAAHDIQDLKLVKTFIFDGHLMRCIQVMSQVTRFRDLLFVNKICLHNDGQQSMVYSQTLNAYTSTYYEIILRTTIEKVNDIQQNMKQSEFYTDDSVKSVKREVYERWGAKELGYGTGDDQSILGLNGYPCTSGLITHLPQSKLTLGMVFSHPLLCSFQPGLSHPPQFDLMLTRSVHNSDLKGLPSMRNIDTTLSELTMITNLNIVDDEMRHTNFKFGYNLGKIIIRKPLIIDH